MLEKPKAPLLAVMAPAAPASGRVSACGSKRPAQGAVGGWDGSSWGVATALLFGGKP